MYKVKNSVSEIGIGMFSGEQIRLSLSEFSQEGIWFKNKKGKIVKLTPYSIIVENNNTAIQFPDGNRVSVIEHLLSAIYAYGITTILIEVDGDEIPLFDGSSASYVMLLEELYLQKKERFQIARLTKKIRVEDNNFFVEVSPSSKIIFDYKIDFKEIGIQEYKYKFSKKSYIEEISRNRTFGIIDNLEEAKKYYKGVNLKNTIIISKGKLLSELRDEKEFVKHKILDAIGDLRTFEYPIIMNYKSFGGSHKLNNMILKKIIKENAYETFEIKQTFFNISNQFVKAYA